MLKRIFKISVIPISICFLIKCDNYEFPKSPYPRIETLTVTNISSTGVNLRGNLIQLGDKPVIDHGFVWGFEKNVKQDVQNEGILRLGAASSTGEFHGDVVSGLFKDKTYYVRAFVNTESYQIYGAAVAFISNGSTPPKIDKFEPSIGTWGDTVTIQGSFFGTAPKTNLVRFGSLEARVIEANETTIICIVPDNIETLVASISVQVTDNKTQAANTFQLTVPIIDDFTPTMGTFLDEVLITGSNFGVNPEKHQVTFGGHPAEVMEASKTSIKVKVPTEVVFKTNELKLTLNRQAATAATPFTMLPPKITSLSKAEGHIGDEIEITGENFNPRLLGNVVVFGESQAIVISASHHTLTAKVTNGIYPQRVGPVEVTVAEQTATSGSSFKLLDVWLKKGYTPVAEVNSGGFEIDNTGYFIAGPYTYSYNPLTNDWTQKANFPGEFRFSPITFAAAGQGYSGGGNKPCCPGGRLTDFWRYSPSTDAWTIRNDIPSEGLGLNGTSAGSKGYSTHGFGPVKVSEYDPDSDSWANISQIIDADLTGYPHHPYTTFTMDNRVFVFFRHDYNYTKVNNYLYEFNVATGIWTKRAEYFDERSVGFSVNGTGYIAGFTSMHEYNLATNQIILNKIPLPDNKWGIEYLFTANDKGYFLGAWANDHYELWEFDPAYLD